MYMAGYGLATVVTCLAVSIEGQMAASQSTLLVDWYYLTLGSFPFLHMLYRANNYKSARKASGCFANGYEWGCHYIITNQESTLPYRPYKYITLSWVIHLYKFYIVLLLACL